MLTPSDGLVACSQPFIVSRPLQILGDPLRHFLPHVHLRRRSGNSPGLGVGTQPDGGPSLERGTRGGEVGGKRRQTAGAGRGRGGGAPASSSRPRLAGWRAGRNPSSRSPPSNLERSSGPAVQGQRVLAFTPKCCILTLK